MPTQSDKAIVLRLTEYSETSQIVVLFSENRGLLRLIAKGARRSTKTRFSAGLDLLERGDLFYAPAKGDAQLGTLAEWTQRDSYSGLRRELVRLYAGLYAAELITVLTEPDDPHPELYMALVELLDALSSESPARPLVPQFQIDLLRAIGYLPDLSKCVDCGHAIRPRAVAYFGSPAGGLICRDCEVHHMDKQRVSPGIVGTEPQTGPPAAWFELLDQHLSHVAGRRFKTADQLRKLLGREG